MTRTPLSRSKGQIVADVLNSQHVRTGATWRINAKILATCRGEGILCRHAHSLLNLGVSVSEGACNVPRGSLQVRLTVADISVSDNILDKLENAIMILK